MRQNPLEDGLLRRYFLGEMSQEEMEEVEKRFGDDEFFELAEAVESDLLAAADRGELAPEERERVLNRLASSPQGRERLALVRALNKAADEEERATPNVVRFPGRAPASRSVVQWAATLAASLLLVSGLAWYSLQKQDARHTKTPVVAEQANGHDNPVRPPKAGEARPATPPEPAPPPPPPPADRLAGREEQPEAVKPLGRAVLQLALAVQRGGGSMGTLRVTPDLGIVELQLDVAGFEDLESFNVTLRKKGQDPIWQESDLAPRPLNGGSALVLEIPAEKLGAGGRYEVRVEGAAAGGEPEELSPLEFEVLTNGKP